MRGTISAPHSLLDIPHADLVRVFQRIPLEQDLVCGDVDLVEQSVDDIHIFSAAGCIATVGLGDVDCRDDHSVVWGDEVFVDVDIGLSRDTIGRNEVILQRDSIDLPVCVVEDMDLSIAIAQDTRLSIPVCDDVLPEELLHLEIHRLLMRTLPNHVAVAIVDRRSGTNFKVIVPYTDEDLARVLILPDLPQGDMRRLPVSRAKPGEGPTGPFLSTIGTPC